MPIIEDDGGGGASKGGGGREGRLSRLSANLSHLAASPAWGDVEGGDAGSKQQHGDSMRKGRISTGRSWFEK